MSRGEVAEAVTVQTPEARKRAERAIRSLAMLGISARGSVSQNNPYDDKLQCSSEQLLGAGLPAKRAWIQLI